MSDPAIEAANRACAELPLQLHGATVRLIAKLAARRGAREALQDIRELHRPYVTNDPRSPYDVVCNHCLGPKKWPCTTALYAYSTEELES